jgi:hypothetical protein
MSLPAEEEEYAVLEFPKLTEFCRGASQKTDRNLPEAEKMGGLFYIWRTYRFPEGQP